MERLTEKHYDGKGYFMKCSENCANDDEMCGGCPQLDKIIDRLAAYEDTGLTPEQIGKPLAEFLHPVVNYAGLKEKYLVFKADTGEQIANFFVLCPDKDTAAVDALRAYAKATDNETLAEDIYSWVGKCVDISNLETYAKEIVPNSRNSFTFLYWQQYQGGKVLVDDGARTAENVTLSNIQLEIGDVTTAYDPSAAQSLNVLIPNGLPGIPVASGGNYTDSNGQQWVCDEIDLARGVYVQRVGSVDLGSLNWAYNALIGDNLFFNTPNSIGARGYALSEKPNVLSSHYVKRTMNEVVNKIEGVAIYADRNAIAIYNADYTDATSFKNAMSGAMLYYELAAPVETPLDADVLAAYAALHTNKPNTTVLNDAGAGQKLAYVADTKLYIDNKFTEMTNAIIASGANI